MVNTSECQIDPRATEHFNVDEIKKVSFFGQEAESPDSPRSVGVASTEAPATSAPASPMADVDAMADADADFDNFQMDAEEAPKTTPAAGLTLKHLRLIDATSAMPERVYAKDVVVPALAPSPSAAALAAKAKPNENKTFREVLPAEKAVRSQGYAGAVSGQKVIANAEAEVIRTKEEPVPEARKAVVPAEPRRSAGQRSTSKSVDAKRDSTLRGLERGGSREVMAAPTTPVKTIQKGDLVQPLTKIQKADLKRERNAALPSVVTTWNATQDVAAAGDKSGKGHHQDNRKSLKLDAVPYEEVKNPKELMNRNMMRMSKHQENMEEFAESAAGAVKEPIFDKLNKKAEAVAPYDDNAASKDRKAPVVDKLESITANAAGNKGNKGHAMGQPGKREQAVPEDNSAAPLRRAPIQKRLQTTKDGQFAGNVKSRGHFLVSEHSKMAEASIVPYSDESKVDMRATPRNFGGAAGNVGDKGHNIHQTRSKSVPAVPYEESSDKRGRIQTGEATGAGNVANRGHHQMRVKNERANGAVAPYETTVPPTKGPRKNSTRNMHTFHATAFEKVDHVRSSVRGANPIQGAVPYQVGDVVRERQNDNTKRAVSAVPYQADSEVRGMRHFPKGAPKMPTTKSVEIVRNARNGGVFRPINHAKVFAHVEHVPSKQYSVPPLQTRRRASFESRSGKRNFSAAPVTGMAVPYENGPATRTKQGSSPSRQSQTLQSTSMTNILKPVAKCQQE